jgi:signal transduction histidine kinase
MGAKEINVFFLAVTLTVLLLVMAVYFIIAALRKRQIFFTKEKESTELLHQQQLLEARQEMQQSLMQSLGAELHDTIGQKLTLAYLQTENALHLDDIDAFKTHIKAQNNLILEALDELRGLSKILISHDFSDFSFLHFMQKETERLQLSGLCKVIFVAPVTMPKAADERVELTLARICQEFIQNSLKYSGCTELKIAIEIADDHMNVLCSDNGKGIDLKKVNAYNVKSGSGMFTISNRAKLIGATCRWATEKGTQLKISLPLHKKDTHEI